MLTIPRLRRAHLPGVWRDYRQVCQEVKPLIMAIMLLTHAGAFLRRGNIAGERLLLNGAEDAED